MTAKEFREARASLGLTQARLAEILNTNLRTVQKWEQEEGGKNARLPNPIACQVLVWLKGGQLQLDLDG